MQQEFFGLGIRINEIDKSVAEDFSAADSSVRELFGENKPGGQGLFVLQLEGVQEVSILTAGLYGASCHPP